MMDSINPIRRGGMDWCLPFSKYDIVEIRLHSS